MKSKSQASELEIFMFIDVLKRYYSLSKHTLKLVMLKNLKEKAILLDLVQVVIWWDGNRVISNSNIIL